MKRLGGPAFAVACCGIVLASHANAQITNSDGANNDNASRPRIVVPERPVLPLPAKGPGSVVLRQSRTLDVLQSSRTIFVQSYTDNFKPDQLVNALSDRAELASWDLSFVDEREVADLILTLDQVDFTWKFTFKLAHQRTGVVVATGDVIIWDGNLGAGRMADRIIRKLKKVRAQTLTPSTEPEKKGTRKNNGGS